MTRKPLSKREAGERWLRISLAVLKRRARARTNGGKTMTVDVGKLSTVPDSLVSPDELPVGELDPAIVELCHAINEFPGLRTCESCQGFVDGHRPGKPWAVYFQPTPSPPTSDGYTSLEFMAWLCCYTARDRGFDVSVELNAPPPYLNGPGECMYFIIKGRNRHPTEFAQFIREVRGRVFCLPVGDDDA